MIQHYFWPSVLLINQDKVPRWFSPSRVLTQSFFRVVTSGAERETWKEPTSRPIKCAHSSDNPFFSLIKLRSMFHLPGGQDIQVFWAPLQLWLILGSRYNDYPPPAPQSPSIRCRLRRPVDISMQGTSHSLPMPNRRPIFSYGNASG